MPIFNEVKTCGLVIDEILKQESLPYSIELIIVESGSDDGSRDLVIRYQDDPRVHIIFQSQPEGKGAAVALGLKVSTGSIILIQDGDLEYSISDHPRLVQPLLESRCDVVLGARFNTFRGMRTMPDNRVRQTFTNFGHVLFAGIFNVLFSTNYKDPFTMFKVFKSECVSGWTFRSKRFDFDWELLAMFERRSFDILEIPVSYQSRGYSEGKKVRLFRDPASWIWAAIRVRLARR